MTQKVFRVGKYKGRTHLSVLDDDPSYLMWAYENVPTFDISEDMYECAVSANGIDNNSQPGDYDWNDCPITEEEMLGHYPGDSD